MLETVIEGFADFLFGPEDNKPPKSESKRKSRRYLVGAWVSKTDMLKMLRGRYESSDREDSPTPNEPETTLENNREPTPQASPEPEDEGERSTWIQLGPDHKPGQEGDVMLEAQ